MASSRPKHVCDIPGCRRGRKATHRTCLVCFDRLPGDIRLGIMEAHHQRRMGDYRRLLGEAADFLNLRREIAPVRSIAAPCPVSPQRAYDLTARMLGERPDA